jgi:hypothetical protein
MEIQSVRNELLVELVFRYEQHPDEFIQLPKPTLDSSLVRLAIAHLRSEGLVEEQVRGVIRLTTIGYKKYKNLLLRYPHAG